MRRENRNVERKLDHLTGHVLVIGFGALGRLVAARLHDAGEQVIVIDASADLAALASNLGYLVVQGEVVDSDDVFDHSGIDRARALIVTTEDPDRKLAITLMARARNPRLHIAVIGANSPRGALLHHAGASKVVITDDLTAAALVDGLSNTIKI
jgi:voltage-gated potassium channel